MRFSLCICFPPEIPQAEPAGGKSKGIRSCVDILRALHATQQQQMAGHLAAAAAAGVGVGANGSGYPNGGYPMPSQFGGNGAGGDFPRAQSVAANGGNGGAETPAGSMWRSEMGSPAPSQAREGATPRATCAVLCSVVLCCAVCVLCLCVLCLCVRWVFVSARGLLWLSVAVDLCIGDTAIPAASASVQPAQPPAQRDVSLSSVQSRCNHHSNTTQSPQLLTPEERQRLKDILGSDAGSVIWVRTHIHPHTHTHPNPPAHPHYTIVCVYFPRRGEGTCRTTSRRRRRRGGSPRW